MQTNFEQIKWNVFLTDAFCHVKIDQIVCEKLKKIKNCKIHLC